MLSPVLPLPRQDLRHHQSKQPRGGGEERGFILFCQLSSLFLFEHKGAGGEVRERREGEEEQPFFSLLPL